MRLLRDVYDPHNDYLSHRICVIEPEILIQDFHFQRETKVHMIQIDDFPEFIQYSDMQVANIHGTIIFARFYKRVTFSNNNRHFPVGNWYFPDNIFFHHTIIETNDIR